jgi:hypothetical protein
MKKPLDPSRWRACTSAALAALALAGAPSPGRAAAPYITDDTGTQGAGNWQLELIGEHVHHDSSAELNGATIEQRRDITVFNPVLTLGLTETVDLALALNYLWVRRTEDGALVESASGISDSVLELKWRSYEEGGLSLAVKPGLILPTGNENRDLGTGKVSPGVNLILTYEARPWIWLANVQYIYLRSKSPQEGSESERSLWRASAGFGYYLRDDLRLVGEAGVRTNPFEDDPFLPGRNGQFAMLGLIYSPAKDADLALGLRRAVNSGESDRAVTVGATFRW